MNATSITPLANAIVFIGLVTLAGLGIVSAGAAILFGVIWWILF